MTAAPEPTEAEKVEAHHLAIVNETAKRVHTVMCNYAEVLGRGKGEILSPGESLAVINGAVSGIAVLVARMAISRNPTATDTRSVEEYYADCLKEQFIGTYRETQQMDAQADLAAGAPVS